MAKGRGTNPNSLANLKPVKLGEIRNPSGRSKQHREVLDRLRQHGDEIVEGLVELISKKRYSREDQIKFNILSGIYQLAYGRPFQGVAIVNDGAVQGPDGQPINILLLKAESEREQNAKRIEARNNSRAAELAALVTDEERERVSGVSVMLAEARLSREGKAPTQWAIVAHLLGEARAIELLGPEPKPDFIAPPPGSGRAPWSASEPPPAADAEALRAADTAVTTKPDRQSPVERAAEAGPSPAPPPPSEKPQKPFGAGMPAEFAAHLRSKADLEATERERLTAIAKQRPGGQLSREEAFPPDAVNGSAQGPLEVVRLGRIPGGRGIRRV